MTAILFVKISIWTLILTVHEHSSALYSTQSIMTLKEKNLPLTNSVFFSVLCHVDLVHSLALWCVWRVTLLLIWVDVEFAPPTLWGHVTQDHVLPGRCLIGPIVLSLVAVVSGMWSPKQSDSALKWQRTANLISYSFSLGRVHDRDLA